MLVLVFCRALFCIQGKDTQNKKIIWSDVTGGSQRYCIEAQSGRQARSFLFSFLLFLFFFTSSSAAIQTHIHRPAASPLHLSPNRRESHSESIHSFLLVKKQHELHSQYKLMFKSHVIYDADSKAFLGNTQEYIMYSRWILHVWTN